MSFAITEDNANEPPLQSPQLALYPSGVCGGVLGDMEEEEMTNKPEKKRVIRVARIGGYDFSKGILENLLFPTTQENRMTFPTNKPKTAKQYAKELNQLESCEHYFDGCCHECRERKIAQSHKLYAQQEGRELVEALSKPCTCEHAQDEHGWGSCGVYGCKCEAGWEE